jgi:hypothetical protein
MAQQAVPDSQAFPGHSGMNRKGAVSHDHPLIQSGDTFFPEDCPPPLRIQVMEQWQFGKRIFDRVDKIRPADGKNIKRSQSFDVSRIWPWMPISDGKITFYAMATRKTGDKFNFKSWYLIG